MTIYKLISYKCTSNFYLFMIIKFTHKQYKNTFDVICAWLWDKVKKVHFQYIKINKNWRINLIIILEKKCFKIKVVM
jgi:hypothetical protein